MRLRVVLNHDGYYLSGASDATRIETNTLPTGGVCVVQNIDELVPLQPYNLFCAGWADEDVLEFNALTQNVPLSTAGFVDDARKLTSVAPVGNVSIVVLVKERAQADAITCVEIAASFQSIEQVLQRNTTQNATQVVAAILSE